MNKYVGVSCPMCGKKFTDNDDVVVCPDCGAPHHRDCYQELGSCVFSSRHEPGFAWHDPAAPTQPAGPAQAPAPFPPADGRQAPPDYSRNFGSQRSDAQDGGPFSGGFTPPMDGMPGTESRFGVRLDESIDGVPIKDFAQFIGPSAYYYLLRFKALAATSQSILVCFSAMLFGFLYYFYRKMYKWGAAMLGLFFICMLPSLVFTYQVFPDVIASMSNTLSTGVADSATLMAAASTHRGLSLLANIGRWVYFAISFVSGLFATRLYYTHSKEAVLGLRERFSGRPDQEFSHALAIRGRTNVFAVVAVIGLLILAYFAYVAFLMVVYNNLLF